MDMAGDGIEFEPGCVDAFRTESAENRAGIEIEHGDDMAVWSVGRVIGLTGRNAPISRNAVATKVSREEMRDSRTAVRIESHEATREIASM
jgi:hypothetical protein